MNDWLWPVLGITALLLLMWFLRWNNRRLDRKHDEEQLRKWQSSRYNPRAPYTWDDENTGG